MPAALIVEDDVRLPVDIDRIAQAIVGRIRPGEMISLHNPMMKRNAFSRQSVEDCLGMRLLYPMTPRSIRSTSAYIITRESAQRIVELNTPARHVADHWDFFYESGAVRTYRVLHPSPCRWVPFDSSIGYGDPASRLGRLRRRLGGIPLMRSVIRARRRAIFWKRLRNVVMVDEASPLTVRTEHE